MTTETKPDIVAMLARRVAAALDTAMPVRLYALGIGSAGSDIARWKGEQESAWIEVDNIAHEIRPGFASAALHDFAVECRGWMFEDFDVCIFAAQTARIDKRGTVDLHLREIELG